METPNEGSDPKPGSTAEQRDTGEIDRLEEVLEAEHVPEGEGRVQLAASFKGPLPPPGVLLEYDQVMPGLAKTIVEQWQAETKHRHETVIEMRKTDHLAMVKYFEAEKTGQIIGLAGAFLLFVLGLVAILSSSPAVGAVAILISGGGPLVWALRRRSDGPPSPVDLSDDEAVVGPGDSTEA